MSAGQLLFFNMCNLITVLKLERLSKEIGDIIKLKMGTGFCSIVLKCLSVGVSDFDESKNFSKTDGLIKEVGLPKSRKAEILQEILLIEITLTVELLVLKVFLESLVMHAIRLSRDEEGYDAPSLGGSLSGYEDV